MKFCVLLFTVISFGLSPNAFAVDIDDSDIPTMYECCAGHVLGYSSNKREVACEDASVSNSSIMTWSPKAFDSPDVSSWSPDFAGIKVKQNGDIVVRFVLDPEDVATFNQTFNNSNTRIPYALEVEAVDAHQTFGTAMRHKDYDVLYSPSMSEAVVKRDLGAMLGFTPNAKKVFEAIIYRPDLLQANVVHEITFHPHSAPSGQVELHMNFQLTVNYKYIQAMNAGSSDKCDLLDGIIYDAYQDRDSLSDGWAKDLNVGNHGDYLPSKAQSGWYYYAVAKTDPSNKLFANSVSEVSQIVGMCWNDAVEDDLSYSFDVTQGDDGIEHNESRSSLCINLFDLNPGDSVQSSSNNNGDTCTSNQDGGMTCVIGNHTHVIHPDYRCSKETNHPILCWEPGGDGNCWDAWKWYQFNGLVYEVADHHNDSGWITNRNRSMCAEVYNDNPGTSIGGEWQPGGPFPIDPNYGNDPKAKDADVHINHLHVKGPGQSNYHTESGAVFYPGQTQTVSLEGKMENRSSDNTDEARMQYCVTTKKKFRHDDRKWVDEDYLDSHERKHDFDPGEKITKHGTAHITLSGDMKSVRVYNKRSYSFSITDKHRYEKKIPLYFYLDTKIEVGNDEDYDISCSVGSHCGDEYAKFEVLLPWFNSKFKLSAVKGIAPLTVLFTNTSEKGNGANVSYFWDFGDGQTSTGEAPIHVYQNPGTYTVILKARSSWGEIRISEATVVVNEVHISPPQKIKLDYVKLCEDKDEDCHSKIRLEKDNLPSWDIRVKLEKKDIWVDVAVDYYCGTTLDLSNAFFLGTVTKDLSSPEYDNFAKKSIYLQDVDLSNCLTTPGDYFLFANVRYSGGSNISNEEGEYVKVTNLSFIDMRTDNLTLINSDEVVVNQPYSVGLNCWNATDREPADVYFLDLYNKKVEEDGWTYLSSLELGGNDLPASGGVSWVEFPADSLTAPSSPGAYYLRACLGDKLNSCSDLLLDITSESKPTFCVDLPSLYQEVQSVYEQYGIAVQKIAQHESKMNHRWEKHLYYQVKYKKYLDKYNATHKAKYKDKYEKYLAKMNHQLERYKRSRNSWQGWKTKKERRWQRYQKKLLLYKKRQKLCQ